MSIKLGILMDGGEREFIDTVLRAVIGCKSRRYVEVGVAYGETFHAVWEAIKGIPDSSVLGIQIPQWEALHCISDRFPGVEVLSTPEQFDGGKSVEVVLGPSTEMIAHPKFPKSVAAVFIDACHGAPCVRADFLAIEPLVELGGCVIFHDAGDREQGGDIQPHCNEPIGVQKAIHSLGLGTWRSGWARIPNINSANQCAVFVRIT